MKRTGIISIKRKREIICLKKYGKFADKLGGYVIDKLPDAGNYEYIYKNDEVLVR